MNEYGLPKWYTKFWEILCNLQGNLDDCNISIRLHVSIGSYLLGLVLGGVIDEVGYNNLYKLIDEVVS